MKPTNFFYIFLAANLCSQFAAASSLRVITDASGRIYQVDPETHRVYSQVVVDNQTVWLGSDRNIYGNPEFPKVVQVRPSAAGESAQPQPDAPSVDLGSPSIPGGSTLGLPPSVSNSPSNGYSPSHPLTPTQAAQITQAVNELFGPGIPVRDYSAVNHAARQNADTAAQANAEAERLKNLQSPPPYTLTPFHPTEEQIRRFRSQSILDVPSAPDPQESDLPFRFQSTGEHRVQLVRLYQHLYKIMPETGKRKNAREMGLASVEEADASFAKGDEHEGNFLSELAEGFLDLAIGLDPVSGVARSTFELLAGRNFVTGGKLSEVEYGLAALNIVTLGANGAFAAAFRGVERVMARLPRWVRLAQSSINALNEAGTTVNFAVAKLGSVLGASNFFRIAGNEVGSLGPDISNLVNSVRSSKIWTEGRFRNSVTNAFNHWSKHKSEFPHLNNAVEYVEEATTFLANPPSGTLTKFRPNGDAMYYHPSSNVFVVKDASGAPRTMFKPTKGQIYFDGL